MAIMIKQLMPECTSCVARVHSGLCSNCPHWTPSVVQELTEEMAERIPKRYSKRICLMALSQFKQCKKKNELSIAVQLVQPQAALDEIAELEKKYRETIERENK